MEEKWRIPLYKIYTDEEDLNLVTKVVRRGNNWAIGPEIEEFETAIKNYVGCKYCLTVNSGTSALHAILLAYGLGNEHEIIVPSFSFISTANSVLFVNGKPVFADIETETYGLDPGSIEEKISSKTKAIIPMDYGGVSCKINEIKDISTKHNLILIEDAAETLGAEVNGKKVGTMADSAIFSFCGNKVITTGEGGAIITNSEEIFEKIKAIRSHGRIDQTAYFDNPSTSNYNELGYNWRISSITAALGLAQLQKLDKIVKLRQEHANFISSKLSKKPEITIPSAPDGFKHIYQMYTIRLENKKVRDDLHNFLLNKRIFSKVYFEPIHLTPFYMSKFGTKKGTLPVTEKISEQVLTLPLYPNMTSEEKNYLIETIMEFFEVN